MLSRRYYDDHDGMEAVWSISVDDDALMTGNCRSGGRTWVLDDDETDGLPPVMLTVGFTMPTPAPKGRMLRPLSSARRALARMLRSES